MKWKTLLPAFALVLAVGCGKDTGGTGGGGKDKDTTGGGGDAQADVEPGDAMQADAGMDVDEGEDTSVADAGDTTGDDDTSTPDAGDTGGDGGMTDAGMKLEGQLVPLGQYSIGGNYALTGRLVPGIEGGMQITGGTLMVEPVKLTPKSP